MRVRVALVGLFRSIIPEGGDSPFGSQGGFVDTLGPEPYSLANALLKAFVEAAPQIASRYQIELLNLAQPLELEEEREEVTLSAQHLDAILALEPEVVAFSGYCWNLEAIGEAAAALKQRRHQILVILGGRATQGEPVSLLRALPAVDVLVLGEGELPFLELLRRDFKNLEDCPGVVYRAGESLCCGAPPVSVQDLDTLPSPYLAGVISPARNGMMLELSRGCLHSCGYCTWNADKQLRYYSPERLEAEIRWALEQGQRHITLNDSALNYDTEALRRNVQALRRADPKGTICYTYNLRQDLLTQEQIAILAQLPTHMVLCGLETLAAEGMAEVDRKPVDLKALEGLLRDLALATRPPVTSLVLGLPGDTEALFRQSVETLLSWSVATGGRPAAVGAVLVSLLQVYRGSKLWHRREELGLRFEPRGIPYLLEGGGWSKEALARSKAYLVQRMAEYPETLKAAEGIALMLSQGGVDPWILPSRIEKLLSPWALGASHDGWTLERIGLQRDTGSGVLLRFGWRDGGGVRIRVSKRNEAGRARFSTGYYALFPTPLPGPVPPREAVSRLVKLVYAALVRNEKAWGP